MSLDLELHAAPDEIARAGAALARWCDAEGIARALAGDLALVLEEALANVVAHGYRGDASGWIGVRAAREGRGVRLEVRDRAPAFDPRSAAAPDLEAPLAERPVGGLGVHLLRSLARSVAYARSGEENRLTLVVGGP